MPGFSDHPFAAWSLLWPAIMAEEASQISAAVARGLTSRVGDRAQELHAAEPGWISANDLVLELASVRLRRFGQSEKTRPILVCAPFALHAATITDIAPDHSLVQALQASTQRPVYVTDWRSADPDMGSRTIDDYLADLNVLVDEIGGAIDLVGLCQGGWMGLVYTARFTPKVHKLVLAGAPVNIAAGRSELARLAQSTPIDVYKELVALGGGRMLGRYLVRCWEPQSLDVAAISSTLQIEHAIESDASHSLHARFRDWYGWTLDLPGRYYLEVVERVLSEQRDRYRALYGPGAPGRPFQGAGSYFCACRSRRSHRRPGSGVRSRGNGGHIAGRNLVRGLCLRPFGAVHGPANAGQSVARDRALAGRTGAHALRRRLKS